MAARNTAKARTGKNPAQGKARVSRAPAAGNAVTDPGPKAAKAAKAAAMTRGPGPTPPGRKTASVRGKPPAVKDLTGTTSLARKANAAQERRAAK